MAGFDVVCRVWFGSVGDSELFRSLMNQFDSADVEKHYFCFRSLILILIT